MTNISKHLLDAEIVMELAFVHSVAHLSTLTLSNIECLWDHKSNSREAAELKTIHTYVSLAYPEIAYYIKSYISSAVITKED